MSTSPPLITGVDFVTLPVDDIDAAVRFYGEALCLPFVERWASMPAAEFQAGNLTIALMDPRAFGGDGEVRTHGTPLALQVDDVPTARALLEERGVVFLGDVLDSGACHQALFRDPAGNVLDLHHRYAPAV
ncbi:VOC family protein [Patulibacter minatonensis]|uniref:VOC family protein n=1 Tax=Patulibacter minatonensis TaxID=298163 RepID=UPI00047C76A1|nr:VOC family protein [Patulibacter minatonensis]